MTRGDVMSLHDAAPLDVMAARGLFITGTDTGVGKTRVAVALMQALANAGLRVTGMKPVSAGIEPGAGVNADVAALAGAANVDAPLGDRNPYAYVEAIAPHLAALAAGGTIDLATIEGAARRLAANADALVVEGAGGALVPLDACHDMLDVAVRLELPVLLVVGLRLGCLNHALLSALAIRRRGLDLCGWVANCLPPRMSGVEANIDALAQRIGLPPVATFDVDAVPRFDGEALAKLGFRG
jgi:dethiobiotin synthetase